MKFFATVALAALALSTEALKMETSAHLQAPPTTVAPSTTTTSTTTNTNTGSNTGSTTPENAPADVDPQP